MIITRTPFRISFAGGGTDLPSFYRAFDGGAVTSGAIDRFIHVLVNEKFDRSIRVAYSKTENVESVDDLQHGLVREALRLTQVHRAVEVHTIADIPGEGTGIGSSSSLTVGLLNALYAYKGQVVDPSRLAEEACRIEINILHGTLGKQDQYIAAFGGLHYFEFRPDDTVRVRPIPLARTDLDMLSSHLSLFYTGTARSSQPILKEQEARTTENRDALLRIRELARSTRDALVARDWDRVGALLDEGWRLKRGLSVGISNDQIDDWYQRGMAAGALGGKITGAGGGGFLLLFHPPERSAQVAQALAPMERLPVRISPEGSRILMVQR
ncbi:MAG: GHMP kinase [Thermoplasmata archaeon]|nr:GHMP kinase [Thermoplasmata archaeon]